MPGIYDEYGALPIPHLHQIPDAPMERRDNEPTDSQRRAGRQRNRQDAAEERRQENLEEHGK